MKRKETIKSQKDFNDLITNGNFHKNKFFVLYYKESKIDKTMYGIAISKKVGKAHTRNYLKRVVRTLIDKNRNLFKNGFNYIIMIRKNCLESNFQELNESMIELLKQ